MSNEAFYIFLGMVSFTLIALSYIVFSILTESVRTVHQKLTDSEKKDQDKK